jgi:hypothetical protein
MIGASRGASATFSRRASHDSENFPVKRRLDSALGCASENLEEVGVAFDAPLANANLEQRLEARVLWQQLPGQMRTKFAVGTLAGRNIDKLHFLIRHEEVAHGQVEAEPYGITRYRTKGRTS